MEDMEMEKLAKTLERSNKRFLKNLLKCDTKRITPRILPDLLDNPYFVPANRYAEAIIGKMIHGEVGVDMNKKIRYWIKL